MSNIEQNTQVIASYRKGHPIDFSLYDENEDYVIYISDDPTENHILKLNLRNSSNQAIKFSTKDEKASKDNCNFELVFRSGTLSEKTLKAFENPGSIIVQDQKNQEWDVALSPAPEDNSRQTVSLYFLYKGKETEFKGGTTRLIILKNMSAAAGSGARGTQVELKLNKLYSRDSNKQITGTQVQKLSIANHVGRKNIPLHIGFVGSNRILNDGRTANELKLRITNISKSKETISLKGASFIFSFDLGGEAWAIAPDSFNPNTEAKYPNNQKIDILDISKVDVGQGQSPEWKLANVQIEKLEYNKYIEIIISGIKTDNPTGYTNLYIRYEKIPGYWDGQFVCVIEKAPLLFYNNNVGISTINPLNTLDVNGSISTQKLFANGNVGIGTTKPISQLSISNNLTKRDDKPDQILGEITFVGFDRPKASASIKAQSPGWDDASHLIFMTSAGAKGAEERMRIQSNGNIGIGTENQPGTLNVYGDFHIKGEKPMVFKVFKGEQKIKTDYSVSDWIVIICGFKVINYDNLVLPIVGVTFITDPGEGKWVIDCNLEDEIIHNLKLEVLFVKKELVECDDS